MHLGVGKCTLSGVDLDLRIEHDMDFPVLEERRVVNEHLDSSPEVCVVLDVPTATSIRADLRSDT